MSPSELGPPAECRSRHMPHDEEVLDDDADDGGDGGGGGDERGVTITGISKGDRSVRGDGGGCSNVYEELSDGNRRRASDAVL